MVKTGQIKDDKVVTSDSDYPPGFRPFSGDGKSLKGEDHDVFGDDLGDPVHTVTDKPEPFVPFSGTGNRLGGDEDEEKEAKK